MRAGRLRAVRLGRRSVRFLPGDVSRWLNARPSITDEVVLSHNQTSSAAAGK